MRCFLACFGCSKKPKRRKSGNIPFSSDQRHGSYEPLQPEVNTKITLIRSHSEFSGDKQKDRSKPKVKKKVSFNLNVKTYEPIPKEDTTDCFWERDEKTTWERNDEEMAKESMSILHSEERSIASRKGSGPPNYRYQNCRASYDEEDDIGFKVSDLEDDNLCDTDEEDGPDTGKDDGVKTSLDEFAEKTYSSMESAKRVTFGQSDEAKTNRRLTSFPALQVQEVMKVERNHNARDRSQYVYSVLNPVENITRWKAIKTRETPWPNHQRKENIVLKKEEHKPLTSVPIFNPLPFNSESNLYRSKPLMPEMAVDASLSNWLASSKAATAKSNATAVSTMSAKKSKLY